MLDACFYRVTEFKLQKKAEHKVQGHFTSLKTGNSGLLTGGKTGFPHLLSPHFCLPNSYTASALCIIFEFEG